MNQAEQARRQHNLDTFGMDRVDLINLIESNRDRLPMFVAGLLSDVQELVDGTPDSKVFRITLRQRMNVAKFALFEMELPRHVAEFLVETDVATVG